MSHYESTDADNICAAVGDAEQAVYALDGTLTYLAELAFAVAYAMVPEGTRLPVPPWKTRNGDHVLARVDPMPVGDE